jgi:hypothetical protein
MLITSPDFSKYYQQFRAALMRCVECSFNMPATAVGDRIDVAALGLFQRGYCGREVDNPEEEKFLKRLNDPKSVDYNLLTSVVDFILRYPQTY